MIIDYYQPHTVSPLSWLMSSSQQVGMRTEFVTPNSAVNGSYPLPTFRAAGLADASKDVAALAAAGFAVEFPSDKQEMIGKDADGNCCGVD